MASYLPSKQLQLHTFWSTRIKDAGIAIRYSQGYILFYTAGTRNGLERVAGHGPGHKKEGDPKKIYVFVIERSLEDIRQDEKYVPDLLESIMRPPDLVNEELRPILFKMDQFGSKI